MQLSDTEKKMVARLRKQEASLLRWRWLGLVCIVLFWGVMGYNTALVIHLLYEPNLSSVLAIACFLPLVYLFAALGGWMTGELWMSWNGRPERRLLLRLIDELQKHDT
jgi:hypothetical protein